MTISRKLCSFVSMALAMCPAIAAAQFDQQPQQQQPQQRQPAQQRRAAPAAQPQVVATVNGDPITVREVDIAVQRELQQLQAENPQQPPQITPETIEQIKPKAIDGLIESRLVEQYAINEGPEVSEQEIKASIDHLKEQLTKQGSSFEQFLASQGHTEQSFTARIKGSLAWQKFQYEQVTDEQLNEFMQKNQERFSGQDLEQAREEVTNAYVGDLWQQIVTQMKSDAEIKMADRQPAQQPPAVPGQPR